MSRIVDSHRAGRHGRRHDARGPPISPTLTRGLALALAGALV